jgi:hypothetical protein
MMDDAGTPLVGSVGTPALVPAGFSAQWFVQQGEAVRSSTLLEQYANLRKFKQGGEWDMQRTQGFFDKRFIDGATVAIGLYAASAGIPYESLMTIQSRYADWKARWPAGTLFDPVWTSLPARNVLNTLIGYELYRSGRVTAGNQGKTP